MSKSKCSTRKLLKPESFLIEFKLAKQLKMCLIYFKNKNKYWATHIPDFYLNSNNVELIKQF